MSIAYPARSDCICNWLGSRTQLYDSHNLIMGRDWYTTSVLNMSDHIRSILMWNYLFYILHFVL
jgi:hypothetical protein